MSSLIFLSNDNFSGDEGNVKFLSIQLTFLLLIKLGRCIVSTISGSLIIHFFIKLFGEDISIGLGGFFLWKLADYKIHLYNHSFEQNSCV
jgi:hypothetical protein